MTRKIKENVIKQLSDKEHVLLRPGQYIGASVLTKCSTFILNKETEKFEYKEIEYVPGFLKIIYEILDNSVDEAIRTNYTYAKNISVTIEDKTNKIIVSDDGRGIPLANAEGTNISQLELALTELRAGSNFNDDEGRILLGMNGVGSSLTNVFSKSFEAEVFDGTLHGHLICKDNLSSKECNITNKKSKKTGTTISFIPDLKRFGLKKIDQVHKDLIHQRLMFLSFTYPEIKFMFNGSLIKFKNTKNFMNCFNDKFVVEQDTNKVSKYLIGVIPNEYDDFTHKSYINGADCINGGNHIDYIHSELVSRIKEKLSKKYSSIKVGDIKNRLSYVINFREFLNPAFNSQTKENFSSNINEIKSFLKDIDWDAFAQKICKCSEIIEPIIESFKIKEELKNRQTLEKIGRTNSKFKCKKFLPATKENKYCAIVEGDSASSGLSAGLGRSQIGYFATRGVPLNTFEVAPSKIADNEELNNIIKCLGLKLNAQKQNMTYENVLLSEDADFDGAHISGLYIAFFYRYAISVIKEGRLKKLRTPIICLRDKNKKIKEMFFTFDEYNNYLNKNSNHKYETHYYKGLGSWKDKDLKDLVNQYGLDRFIETLEYDEETDKLVNDWCSKKNAEVRKEYLRENEFSIFGI
jgi:DNA gyrase/topoisomerase IV subunit B